MDKKLIVLFVSTFLMATVIQVSASQNDNAASIMVLHSRAKPSALINWTEIQKLLPSDGAAEDYFSDKAVALDGDTAIIGAMYNDDHGKNSGSAYVFVRSGTTWTQQATLAAPDAKAGDCFGSAVAIDGNTALVGAENDYNDSEDSSGSTYVFVRTGGTWTLQAKLLALDGQLYDNFGNAVALDGDTALIGSQLDDDYAEGSGSAYVFIRTGSNWTQQKKLLALNPGTEDLFGASVSLDGDTALVGVPCDDDQGVDSGSAYVFTRTGTVWHRQGKLLSSDGAANDNFGWSVSLSGDTALIGATYKDFGAGSAYIFTRTGGNWTQQTKLLPEEIGPGDNFGYAVALFDDIALIGAPIFDHSGTETGSAYVYMCNGTTWIQEVNLFASNGAKFDFFGNSVALSGDTALIGACGDDDQGNESGSACIFKGPNQPPNPPTITGPPNGKVRSSYEYTFTTQDPENNKIFLFIDWEDGTYSDWMGPYTSGTQVTKSHTWYKQGTYQIKAKAKDTYGNEGDWGTLPITMPCSFVIPFQHFWERLFERFPGIFPILRHLVGY